MAELRFSLRQYHRCDRVLPSTRMPSADCRPSLRLPPGQLRNLRRDARASLRRPGTGHHGASPHRHRVAHSHRILRRRESIPDRQTEIDLRTPVARRCVSRGCAMQQRYPLMVSPYQLFLSSRSFRNTALGFGWLPISGYCSASRAITDGLVRRKKVFISRSWASVVTRASFGSWFS